MSALADAKSSGVITDQLLTIARPLFAAAVWAWFDANRDRVLFTRRILFWSVTLRLSDLAPLIVDIAGPHPA